VVSAGSVAAAPPALVLAGAEDRGAFATATAAAMMHMCCSRAPLRLVRCPLREHHLLVLKLAPKLLLLQLLLLLLQHPLLLLLLLPQRTLLLIELPLRDGELLRCMLPLLLQLPLSISLPTLNEIKLMKRLRKCFVLGYSCHGRGSCNGLRCRWCATINASSAQHARLVDAEVAQVCLGKLCDDSALQLSALARQRAHGGGHGVRTSLAVRALE